MGYDDNAAVCDGRLPTTMVIASASILFNFFNQVTSVWICRGFGPIPLEQVFGRAGENFVRGYVRNRRLPLSMETET